MNERDERLRRLIARIRNDARAIAKRDKRQVRLLIDIVQTANLMEVEVLKRSEILTTGEVR